MQAAISWEYIGQPLKSYTAQAGMAQLFGYHLVHKTVNKKATLEL